MKVFFLILGVVFLGIATLSLFFWGFFLFSICLSLGVREDGSIGDFIPIFIIFCKNNIIIAMISLVLAIICLPLYEKMEVRFLKKNKK